MVYFMRHYGESERVSLCVSVCTHWRVRERERERVRKVEFLAAALLYSPSDNALQQTA